MSVEALASKEKTITTDSETGAQKEQQLARFDLVPPRPLWMLSEHYGRGAKKYADRNWEQGYDWSKSYDSLNHHLNKWWQGEDMDPGDPECGVEPFPHMVAVAWHAFALLEFSLTHPEKDNRPSRGT
jgi:hypothetical protein